MFGRKRSRRPVDSIEPDLSRASQGSFTGGLYQRGLLVHVFDAASEVLFSSKLETNDFVLDFLGVEGVGSASAQTRPLLKSGSVQKEGGSL